MSLKQPNKNRVDSTNTQWGDWDYDRERLVLHNGTLYTGYVVLDRFPDNSIENEIEYKNGSHVGWENEYHSNGNLIYSCLTVGETTLEVYKYDNYGALLEHWKSVDDDYYYMMVSKYNLD
jgi:antitoxin component YwqK of YwqJK toxin-antitoxin module